MTGSCRAGRPTPTGRYERFPLPHSTEPRARELGAGAGRGELGAPDAGHPNDAESDSTMPRGWTSHPPLTTWTSSAWRTTIWRCVQSSNE